jgi:hypothetical protein
MQSPWHGRHGHGLAVAARIAEVHGGRLVATSGRLGSRVEIELPLAQPLGAIASAAGTLTLERAYGGGR